MDTLIVFAVVVVVGLMISIPVRAMYRAATRPTTRFVAARPVNRRDDRDITVGTAWLMNATQEDTVRVR